MRAFFIVPIIAAGVFLSGCDRVCHRCPCDRGGFIKYGHNREYPGRSGDYCEDGYRPYCPPCEQMMNPPPPPPGKKPPTPPPKPPPGIQ